MAAASKPLRRAGVVGAPVGHSLSPLIHETWAEREGVAAAYEAVEIAPGGAALADGLSLLMEADWRGANVTLPHKENALRWALEAGGAASEGALAAGAANMLTFGGDAPYADNSDIDGFAGALEEALLADDRRERAVVLGAGGAARGVILALSSLGYRRIVVANRTREKAEDLAARFGASTADWSASARTLDGADVVVNTTSLGMAGEPPLEIDLAPLSGDAIVADIVYAPLETPLLKAARARGLRTSDGLSMLMHQAVPGYKAWIGRVADVDAGMRRRLEAALAARSAK